MEPGSKNSNLAFAKAPRLNKRHMAGIGEGGVVVVVREERC